MNDQYWADISLCFQEIYNKKNSLYKSKVSDKTISEVRDTALMCLLQLKGSLSKSLETEFVYLVLFPIVSLLDEEMQCDSIKHKVNWKILQKELYDTSNAGEQFYQILDDILDNQNTPSIIYEVFYFILKKGYKGKFIDCESRITRYLDFLREHIPNNIKESKSQSTTTVQINRNFSQKKWHYVAYFCAFTVSAYTFFYLLSNNM